jgi:hypothetical protein
MRFELLDWLSQGLSCLYLCDLCVDIGSRLPEISDNCTSSPTVFASQQRLLYLSLSPSLLRRARAPPHSTEHQRFSALEAPAFSCNLPPCPRGARSSPRADPPLPRGVPLQHRVRHQRGTLRVCTAVGQRSTSKGAPAFRVACVQ